MQFCDFCVFQCFFFIFLTFFVWLGCILSHSSPINTKITFSLRKQTSEFWRLLFRFRRHLVIYTARNMYQNLFNCLEYLQNYIQSLWMYTKIYLEYIHFQNTIQTYTVFKDIYIIIHSSIYKCIGHLLIPSNKKWNSQGPFPIFSFCLNVWNKEIWQNFPLIFHFRWHRGCSFVFSISETIKADLVGVVFDKRETS